MMSNHLHQITMIILIYLFIYLFYFFKFFFVPVYSVGPAEVVDPLIYDGLVEELVEVLEIKGTDIVVC